MDPHGICGNWTCKIITAAGMEQSSKNATIATHAGSFPREAERLPSMSLCLQGEGRPGVNTGKGKERQMLKNSTGWVAQLAGALSHVPKGCSAGSSVGHVREATDRCLSSAPPPTSFSKTQRNRTDPPFTAQDFKLPFRLFTRERDQIQVCLSKEYRRDPVRTCRTLERLSLIKYPWPKGQTGPGQWNEVQNSSTFCLRYVSRSTWQTPWCLS